MIDEELKHAVAQEIWDALSASGLAYEAEERRANVSAEAAILAILTALEAKGYVIEQGWQPIETAAQYTGEVELYRSDAGVLWGERTTLKESGYVTEREIESGKYSDEELDALDWWYWGPNGPVRLEGDETPTHWRPLPEPPSPARGEPQP